MGFLTGFVGGMAGAYNDDRDAEKLDARKKQLAEYESQLQMNRMVMQETLRERLKQAEMKAKRDQDVADGKTVQEGAQQIDTERSAGLINRTVGPVPTPAVNEIDGSTNEFAGKKMTAADIATIRNNMTPEDAKKFYGIEPLNRVQQAEDSGVAARNAGLINMSKEFRAEAGEYRQQNLEAAKVVRMEDQTKEQKRANDIRDKEATAREDNRDRLAAVAEARQTLAERKSNGSDGKLGREERLKYTSLFAESGRRMSDVQKSMSTITKSLTELTKYNAGQPDTPEITEARDQLKSLKGDYDSYKDERSTYQSLLAGTDGKEPAAKPDPAPKPAPEADKFIPGKKYKDAKGNVATYMGNGKWN
jgi:hypothetical protein